MINLVGMFPGKIIVSRLAAIFLCCSALLVLIGCNSADPFTLDATLAARRPGIETAEANPAVAPGTDAPDPGLTPTRTVNATPRPAATPAPALVIDPNLLTGLTIRFWHPWSGETALAVEKLVELYNLSNELGIQVEVSAPGSLEALNQQVEQALQTGAGALPDLTAAYLFQALEWDARSPLVDLQPYLADSTWGMKPEEQADFYSVFWNAGLIGDRQPGIPALGSGQVLYYNQTWAEELGFTDPPDTPTEFERQACLAAQANRQDADPDNDNSGGLIIDTHYSAMLGWLGAFEAQIFDPLKAEGETNPYHFASPEVRETFTFLRSLYDKGCAWLPEEPYPEEAFANRRALFAVNSIANLSFQSDVFANSASRDRWTVLPFPTTSGQPALSVYGPAFEVFETTPERQLAAWLFARWLLSPQNQARLVEALENLPVRKSALQHLGDYQASRARWAAALSFLENARAEPVARSWKTVRWALSDAATQLFRSYFNIDQTPALVNFLDRTARELNNAIEQGSADSRAP